MNAIGRIFQVLLILFLVRIALRFIARLTGAASAPRPTSRPNQPATREGGQLVRDPHCGTHLPIGRALRQGSGDSAVYFCSEDCRNAWASRKAG